MRGNPLSLRPQERHDDLVLCFADDFVLGFEFDLDTVENQLGSFVMVNKVMDKAEYRPMSEFDPAKPAILHDVLNDRPFEWKPEKYLDSYRRYAEPEGTKMIAWDGLLFDGWREPAHTPTSS